jgi:conjugal transfer pilus assembly protein TraB
MAHETERSGGEPAADNGQVAATPESRREVGRRNLNRQIAQRQKALLIGVGAIALVGGATFLFGGDNDKGSGASGEAVTIDTGGLVNRNLSEREFVATYGNRADAQDREIKALKEGQVSRPELEQQLAALKTEKCADAH